MIPQFEPIEGFGGSELLCPNCNSTHLHHSKVEVFEREEDAAYGIHVTIESDKVEMDTSLEGNPSHRRHGIKIHFWCEECQGLPVLSIAQHKGTTQVDFEYKPNPHPEE